MVNDTAKVYIVLKNKTIESIYSEDGNLPVVVLDMDTLHNEPGNIRNEIEQWRNDLRKLAVNGGKLSEIEYWDAKEFV